MSHVLETEKLFEVVYNKYEEKGVDSFMKQTYTDMSPFYFRVRNSSVHHNFTDIHSGSQDIQEIIDYFERCYKIDMDAVEEYKAITPNKKIHEIALYCANKTKEFLDKVKEVAMREATDNKRNGADFEPAANILFN